VLHELTIAGSATSTNLKRKRSPETAPSPEKGPPTSAAIRVESVQSDSRCLSRNNDQTYNSPIKKPHVPFISRKIDDQSQDKLADQNVLDDLGVEQIDEQGGKHSVSVHHDFNDKGSLEGPLTSVRFTTPPKMDGKTLTHSPISRDKSRSKALGSESSSSPVDGSHSLKIRRTARARKATQPNATIDVFGTVNAPPLLPRRKAQGLGSARADADAFSGMSAVALRALTSSNTTRNQKYIAAKLETEVIRREGARPDSPTVKIKTTIQRREEERAEQRKERAERRARRSDDGFGFPDAEGHFPTSMSIDGESDWDLDEQGDERRTASKHQRGPGDEEDYETPEKSERLPKRSRAEGDVREEKKRVKWDHGLSTAIFVDDVHPRTRAHPDKNLIRKGCLARTAKAS
jgi:hypothetical protein